MAVFRFIIFVFKTDMSESRKKLSGHQYKRLREEKRKKQEDVIQKIRKLDTFFATEEKAGSSTQSSCSMTTSSVADDNNVCVRTPDLELTQTEANPSTASSSCSMTSSAEDNNVCAETAVLELRGEAISPSPSSSTATKESSTVTEILSELNFAEFNEDPSEWTINDHTIDYVTKHGFKQDLKKINFLKSKRTYSDQIRYCPETIFEKKLLNGEVKPREWIVYSEKTGRVFCAPCLLFKNTDSYFGRDGFADWKNVHPRVQEHENSKSHKTSVFNFICRERDIGRIDSLMQKQLNDEIIYWQNVLRRVVATVKSLTSRGLALRGVNEKIGVTNNGNFLMCIELLAQFDPFLSAHIARYGEKGSGSTSYLSSTTYEEIIAIMANKVIKAVVKELEKAKYFSLVVDSTPDISHSDQLAVIVRYVKDEDALPVERFLTFLPNVGHKGQDMFNAVITLFESLNINIKNCRGQSYDNAANMTGVYNGLQAKIKEVSPEAYHVPCAAHSLNLVGEKASQCCLEASNFFSFLQELYNFFASSTARWNILQSHHESASLKSLSATRWSARDDACKSLRRAPEKIYEALKFLENDDLQKSTTKNEAKALRRKLERFETAFMIVVWGYLLDRINAVNKALQKVEINVMEVIEMYDSLVALIESVRHKFEEYENEAKQIFVLEAPEYEADNKRKKTRKLQADESRETEVTMNGRDSFRISTFLVIVDCLAVEIRKRRDAYEEFNKKFAFLNIDNLGKMSFEDIKANSSHLRTSYPKDIDIQLEDELSHFAAHCVSKTELVLSEVPTSILKLYEWFNNMNLRTIYPNIDIVFRLCLCTPCTNCSAERSFSCLKRIKNFLRSTVGQERLSATAILNIESELTASLEFEDVIQDFARNKSRRKVFV